VVKTLLLAAALALAGCATAPPAPRVEVRYVQVDPPAPPLVNRPELPVLALREGDDAGAVLQAHRETIKLLQAWGLRLEALLDAYRPKEKK
jgi:hypothetical protein